MVQKILVNKLHSEYEITYSIISELKLGDFVKGDDGNIYLFSKYILDAELIKFLNIYKDYHQLYNDVQFLKIDGVSVFFVLSGFLIGGILLRIITETNFTKKDLLNLELNLKKFFI